jgi:hypothetical protein
MEHPNELPPDLPPLSDDPDQVIRAWGHPTDSFALRKPAGWVEDRTHREWRAGQLIRNPKTGDLERYDRLYSTRLLDEEFGAVDPWRRHPVPASLDPAFDALYPEVSFLRVQRGVSVEPERPLPDVLDGHLRGMAMVTPGFELLNVEEPGSMAGLPYVEATCRYQFAHAALPEWYPTREHILLIDHGPRIWHLRLVDYPELGTHMALSQLHLCELVMFRVRR